MFNARDCALANYMLEMLRRDMTRYGPGEAMPWGWTSVLLWMSEEAASYAMTLRTPDATRRDLLDLARQARMRVREARRSLREVA